ncbi:MAG TPA: hypothetical protein DEB39_10125 [Planctomycetaceae bacterium]|nr:hypothetical protein [Planctomycetaceae bacterium]
MDTASANDETILGNDSLLGRDRPVAVITGASSGLGEEYAWQLAAAGYDLLLVARRETVLQKLQAAIEATYGIRSEPFRCNLAIPSDLARLEERIARIAALEFMVNNAGFGFDSAFPNVDIEQQCTMVQVHCIATLRLSQAALRIMCARRKGYLINVSSIAAMTFGTSVAQYCATKAYVLSLSRSLWGDAKPYGVNVQALCPGFVHTGFHATETMKGFDKSKMPGFLWLTSRYVVRKSLAAVRKKNCRDVSIPSLRYKLLALLFRMPFSSILIRALYAKRDAARKSETPLAPEQTV